MAPLALPEDWSANKALRTAMFIFWFQVCGGVVQMQSLARREGVPEAVDSTFFKLVLCVGHCLDRVCKYLLLFSPDFYRHKLFQSLRHGDLNIAITDIKPDIKIDDVLGAPLRFSGSNSNRLVHEFWISLYNLHSWYHNGFPNIADYLKASQINENLTGIYANNRAIEIRPPMALLAIDQHGKPLGPEVMSMRKAFSAPKPTPTPTASSAPVQTAEPAPAPTSASAPVQTAEPAPAPVLLPVPALLPTPAAPAIDHTRRMQPPPKLIAPTDPRLSRLCTPMKAPKKSNLKSILKSMSRASSKRKSVGFKF